MAVLTVSLEEQRRLRLQEMSRLATRQEVEEMELGYEGETVYVAPLVDIARQFRVTAGGLAQRLRRQFHWVLEPLAETVFNPDMGSGGRFIQMKKLWLQQCQIEAAMVVAQEMRWWNDRRNGRMRVA